MLFLFVALICSEVTMCPCASCHCHLEQRSSLHVRMKIGQPPLLCGNKRQTLLEPDIVIADLHSQSLTLTLTLSSLWGSIDECPRSIVCCNLSDLSKRCLMGQLGQFRRGCDQLFRQGLFFFFFFFFFFAEEML
jgi:hypothetical protein